MSGTAAEADSSSQSAEVDRLFAEWDNERSPGCALAVLKDGEILHRRAYGMANLDHDVKITPRTVFHVASVSKQFTAAAILLLVQDGKVALDDEIRKYVPEVPDFGVPITLRHLLHHTSGLRDQWTLLTLAGWRYSRDLIKDNDVLAVLSRQQALNFEPGSKFLYSNTGYTLLAQVVKTVTGTSFRDFTTARLFQPLGMTRTHFRDNHAEIVKDMAYGYVRRQGRTELSVTNFDTVGATSLLTTVEDLALWDENFYSARIGGQSFIDQLQTAGRLTDGTPLSYAAGLMAGKYRGLKIVEHAGRDAGYRAQLLRFPDQHFSVAVLCNLASIDVNGLARKIADVFLESAFKAPPETTVQALSPQPGREDLRKWTGLYLSPGAHDRVYRVRLNGDQLEGGPNVDGRPLKVEAITDTRFRFVDYPTIELVFQAGEAGAPHQLTTYDNGKALYRYAQVPAYKPAIAELQQVVGVYRSDEVDMPYEITLKDARLAMRSLKSETIVLHPISADRFGGGGYTVRFTRDPNGDITGALLSTDRVYDFRLKRQPG